MAGPVVAYGSQLPNTIIYYTPHDLPPSLPPMAGPVYLSWLRPCNYLLASGPIRKVGGGGGGGGGALPYDDTMIYIFVCVRARRALSASEEAPNNYGINLLLIIIR